MNLHRPEVKTRLQREKLIRAGTLHSVHWLILSLSIILTVAAWYFSSEQVKQKVSERFERESLQVVEQLKERITLYEQALWGAAAFHYANDHKIDNLKWKKYAESLHIDKTYPGINGIGIIYNIKPKQLNSYLNKERAYRDNYAIHPVHQQSEYWPITYIEPVNLNEKAVGLDVAFETNRYTAIKKARDSGLAMLTGPITLVQDDKKTPGFLFYVPIYKGGAFQNSIEERQKNIIGVSYAPFIMDKLISGTLAIENRLVSLKVSDGDEVLYDDSNYLNSVKVDHTPLFNKAVDIDFYGRVWHFTIESNLAFRKASESYQPMIILFSGIFIDLFILGLFLFLSRSNRQALMYADAMTEELRTNTKRLIKSNQDLEQFAYIASHDLKSPLNAIQKIVLWLKEDCVDILPESSLKHLTLLESRSERMSNLLNDLLNYSRVERFDYKPEKLQLSSIGNDVFSLLDHGEKVKFFTAEGELMFPRVPLEIMLRNLISNAIKHHDKKIINITMVYEINDNMHCISIEDDGPGIPPELFHKALEMFQTLKPRDKVEGSGMGLALVQKITLHYDGKLTIVSDGIRGTKITIMFPIKKNT